MNDDKDQISNICNIKTHWVYLSIWESISCEKNK